MRPRTRLAGLAIATAAALVPVAASQAAIPDLKAKPCDVKWVVGPGGTTVFDDAAGNRFDVENKTSDPEHPMGYDTVSYDDPTYDPC
jgi:hypothetical protein